MDEVFTDIEVVGFVKIMYVEELWCGTFWKDSDCIEALLSFLPNIETELVKKLLKENSYRYNKMREMEAENS